MAREFIKKKIRAQSSRKFNIFGENIFCWILRSLNPRIPIQSLFRYWYRFMRPLRSGIVIPLREKFPRKMLIGPIKFFDKTFSERGKKRNRWAFNANATAAFWRRMQEKWKGKYCLNIHAGWPQPGDWRPIWLRPVFLNILPTSLGMNLMSRCYPQQNPAQLLLTIPKWWVLAIAFQTAFGLNDTCTDIRLNSAILFSPLLILRKAINLKRSIGSELHHDMEDFWNN